MEDVVCGLCWRGAHKRGKRFDMKCNVESRLDKKFFDMRKALTQASIGNCKEEVREREWITWEGGEEEDWTKKRIRS